MRVAGFLKARNEIVREGNIYSALETLKRTCDCGVLCDDASTDGTTEVLEAFVNAQPPEHRWVLLKIEPHEQDFGKEMLVKQQMMEVLHAELCLEEGEDWIFWLDADEVLEERGINGFRQWLDVAGNMSPAQTPSSYKFHYTQAWRNTTWARTDGGFDDGWFFKLWRYRKDLAFDTREGTHHAQFPLQVDPGQAGVAPYEIIHLGNVGTNLRWKGIQYHGGRGGVDRHLGFGHTPSESLASGAGFDQASWSEPNPTYREIDQKLYPSFVARMPGNKPEPFTLDHIKRIRSLQDMRNLEKTFCVIVPAYNRARSLPKALDSLLAQTYDKWVAFVLDDGSTDDTAAVMRRYQDLDPRIFYGRYRTNRGGVAMNEVGMNIACEVAEWWTRLGSDDWFGPKKLELDAKALEHYEACYGKYVDLHGTTFGDTRNLKVSPEAIKRSLLAGSYVVSWANVAVRTSALKRVQIAFGEFCDKKLRNCEDFLCNARLVHTGTDFHYREPETLELEAIWNVAPSGGASSQDHAHVLANDEALTRQLIARMVAP